MSGKGICSSGGGSVLAFAVVDSAIACQTRWGAVGLPAPASGISSAQLHKEYTTGQLLQLSLLSSGARLPATTAAAAAAAVQRHRGSERQSNVAPASWPALPEGG